MRNHWMLAFACLALLLPAGCSTSSGLEETRYAFTFTFDPPQPRAGSVVSVHVKMKRISGDDLNFGITTNGTAFKLTASDGELAVIRGSANGSGSSEGDFEWQVPAGATSAVFLARLDTRGYAIHRVTIAP